ncbi:Potassium channel domain-containing protein [Caenorhabditis elegans]|uniref:Potassium channel domain-containing protein n=1 Tax=Caenorhabditis elegans TaxID=6239 RepID=O45422_CAEEL|nr:Potassium channel domain-containing protein [Caenorhabditis elegans]CAB07375.3 Potassium channel domain-containing protein [Caenorhabditis elegans]|eukprot:NP_508031.3 TWiK family of potassium channels [Caenorhabditis elegans]
MLLSHGEHRQSFKQKRAEEKRRWSSSGSHHQPQAKQSLAVLAQLMLPALIEEHTAQQEDVVVPTHYKADGSLSRTASNRRHVFQSVNLLQRANGQMRKGAAGVWDIAGRAHLAGKRKVEQLQQKPPLWLVILNQAYHKYGLKHAVLIIVFLIYCISGGLVFWLIEEPYQSELRDAWQHKIENNRTARVDAMMKKIFNNSDYLIYIKGNTSQRLTTFFIEELGSYENQLGVKWSQQKMDWDFWNAVLFAGTICTTIGYGHIYPMTDAGRMLTMIFALFGIPLMLLVLQDFGKLLTITMKFPWFQTKRLMRRIMRCCTKQPIEEMKEIERQERHDLDIFDLPLPVGIALIVTWIFICSFVLSVWDHNWTLLESFYFFFTSLSTVGLGDLVPSSPRLLITMFGFILVGLSLVSMVINLLQAKMKSTYEAGRNDEKTPHIHQTLPTSLGVLQCFSPDEEKKTDYSERSLSRSTQTSLSLPGVRQVVLRSDGVHWVNTDTSSPTKSPDEVTNLVEYETALRVCEQIGDNNNEEFSEAESLICETEVLLEVGECLSDLEEFLA